MQHVESTAAPLIKVDGREISSFGGCSYLGLANLPEILSAGQVALGDLGATAHLPRHYGFQSPANLAAEEAARQFFGAEDAMYFSTGYLFPLIALPALADDYARGAALGISAGAAMLSASLGYLREHPERFTWLRDNADRMLEGLKILGPSCYDTPGPIFAFTSGSVAQMRTIKTVHYDEGIFIIDSNYVRGGPEGALRIAVFADHEPDHITRPLTSLCRHLETTKSQNYKELSVQ